MRILILGGGLFLGRHVAVAAAARGHQVTLFNRGRARQEAADDGEMTLERIAGDRRRDLDRLAGRRFDACIDTSGYVPGQIATAGALLAPAVAHYTFISTLAVYADAVDGSFDESAPVAALAPGADLARLEALEPEGPVIAATYGEHYGALKALCEAAAERAWTDRCLIIRPGLIVGPRDPTDRFTYWPARIAAGGEVLAPGQAASPIRLIDARDLAGWTLSMIERGQTGTFNATGAATTLGTILDACRAVANPGAHLVWVPDDFLLREGAVPWVGIPLWVPTAIDPGAPLRAESTAARAHGLTLRPLGETIAATLAWDRARSPDAPRGAGLSRARERALLDAWRAVSTS